MKIENVEKITILYEYPQYLDLIQSEVDKVSHIFRNLVSLEGRVQSKVASSITNGHTSLASVKRIISKAITAEKNRKKGSLRKHDCCNFTMLERYTEDGESLMYEAVSADNIEGNLLKKERIKKIVSLATNDEERIIINGLADGLSDKSIGELLAQLYPTKKSDTHRKSVRKFRDRCKLALTGYQFADCEVQGA